MAADTTAENETSHAELPKPNDKQKYDLAHWPIMSQNTIDQYRAALESHLLDRAAIEQAKDTLADIRRLRVSTYPKDTEMRLQAIVERLEAIEATAREANDSFTAVGTKPFRQVVHGLPRDINFLLEHILTLEKNINTLERLIQQNSLIISD